MKKPITFIHAADLHLDSPFIGLKHLPELIFNKLKDSTFLAFSKLISSAIKEKVDFVLLSGDLYDGEDRSLKAQLKLKKEFERLYEAGIQVYVIHGNHDHVGGSWLDLHWPNNVHVFSSNQVEMKIYCKNGTPHAYIYGYSYPTRSVTDRIIKHYSKKHNSEVFHIGMLHGSVEGNKEHDTYCPFNIRDLVAKEFDYWALGHIHKRQFLHERNPTIVYPGNIQGRHLRETGVKGCYLVQMNEEGPTTSFVPTGEICWKEIEITIDDVKNISELLNKCEDKVDRIRGTYQSTCLSIVLTGSGELTNVLQPETMQDLMDALNEGEGEQEHFVWIVNLKDKTAKYEIKDPKITSFLSDLHDTVENYQSFAEVIEPLSKNPIYRKFIEAFTEEEQKQLVKEAELLLQRELLQQQRAEK